MIKAQLKWLLDHAAELELSPDQILEMDLEELDYYCNLEETCPNRGPEL